MRCHIHLHHRALCMATRPAATVARSCQTCCRISAMRESHLRSFASEPSLRAILRIVRCDRSCLEKRSFIHCCSAVRGGHTRGMYGLPRACPEAGHPPAISAGGWNGHTCFLDSLGRTCARKGACSDPERCPGKWGTAPRQGYHVPS